MDIYQIIEDHVISQMTPVIDLTLIEEVSADRYKLHSCNTEWATVGDTIEIDGENYKVVEFSINEYLIVTGTVEPVQMWFQIPEPYFEYGNHRKVNNERVKQKNKTALTPLVYMMPVRNETENAYDNAYSFEGRARVFFLSAFNGRKDDIDTHQKEVIEPMKAMSRMFIEKINDRPDLFEDVFGINEFEWMDFGNPQIWGNSQRIFDENLSGVENEFELKAFDIDDCCASTESETCLPVRIYEDDVLVDTIASGGSYSYTSGGSASIDIDINSTSFVTGQSTNIDIPVLNTNNDPVGVENPLGTWKIGVSEVQILNSNSTYDVTEQVVAEGVGVHNLPDETFYIQIDGVTVATETEPALATQTFNINWN